MNFEIRRRYDRYAGIFTNFDGRYFKNDVLFSKSEQYNISGLS